MTTLVKTLAAVAAGAVFGTSALAQDTKRGDPIEHHIAKIDGTRFHCVTAGTGDPVLLFPQWPERLCPCWSAPAAASSSSTPEVSVRATSRPGLRSRHRRPRPSWIP